MGIKEEHYHNDGQTNRVFAEFSEDHNDHNGAEDYSVICWTNISQSAGRIFPERQEFIQLSNTNDDNTINSSCPI